MPGIPKKSAQQALSTLYGAISLTRLSPQAVLNLQLGLSPTTKSYQQILNEALGNPPTLLSPQAALYQLLLTPLGLTPAQTQLSEQQLLNMATDAGISIAVLVATYTPPASGATGTPFGALGMTYA